MLRTSLLASIVAVGPLAAQQDVVLRGREVALYNLVGELRVEGASGDDVRVQVTRRGPDGSKLRVESGSLQGKETLRILYPGDRVVYDQDGTRRGRWNRSTITKLRVSEEGTFNGEWRSGRGRSVEIATSGDGLEAAADLRVMVPRGKSIDLNLAAGTVTIRNVEGDISLEVQAADVDASGTKGRLNLDTGSGDVLVRDVEGEVFLDTGSGEVKVEGMRGRELKMDTGSGALTLSRVDVEQLGLDSGSGRVVLRGVKARDLSVDTGSGSVEIDMDSDVERLLVDTGSGGITLGVPSGFGAQLTIDSGSGGIDLDVPVRVTRSERRYLQGVLGDGAGRVRIETGSGSVRIRPSTMSR
jgi:hypothetical protein